jgi:hypothetical protein
LSIIASFQPGTKPSLGSRLLDHKILQPPLAVSHSLSPLDCHSSHAGVS